jgi:hypothetical protein
MVTIQEYIKETTNKITNLQEKLNIEKATLKALKKQLKAKNKIWGISCST